MQLRRRADLVPNRVEAVQGYAVHERERLQRVTETRRQAGEVAPGNVAARAQASFASAMPAPSSSSTGFGGDGASGGEGRPGSPARPLGGGRGPSPG